MTDILTDLADKQREIDESWMRYALRLAQRAQDQGEVPVGAVLVVPNIAHPFPSPKGWDPPPEGGEPQTS